jgi:hypothetical protein
VLIMRDEPASASDLYFAEVLRLENKRVPFWLLSSGALFLIVALWRLYAGPIDWRYIALLVLAAPVFFAGLAVSINDHFERKRFIRLYSAVTEETRKGTLPLREAFKS